MPYKDRARQLEAQRNWRRKNKRKRKPDAQTRAREQRAQAAKRERAKADFDPMLDLAPEHARSCYWRFHTTNRCRRIARWISPTATKWCDEHAKGKHDLRAIEG